MGTKKLSMKDKIALGGLKSLIVGVVVGIVLAYLMLVVIGF
jgi:hypothetical protein